ncbi:MULTISPECIES: ShlB/FhaC/HecB family hemolysin secretion/activation protein [Nostocales]|uniref:Hemolysin activation/secretion protein n=3 Tax=Nostocales TaxID=1161 RepID=A0A0C1R3N2_9CYAN|nr:ShlB/FhaC/HecB family hemolysin secretion/activation protein [Tolypothrix bouteillei]KAF3889709.1 ShlB/FhaC/HecB family hemolysin secretion/activation protein [Tolypothrix bouteillei VB521301]
MSMGKQPGYVKLNFAVSLVLEALIATSCTCKVSAESVPHDRFNSKSLPLSQLKILTLTSSKTASDNLISQVPNSPDLPNPLTPTPPPPQPVPDPQPLPETPLDTTPPKPPSSETSPELSGTITVKKFEFEGNTAFSDETLSKKTAEYTNRPITFSQLLQVEAVITKLYIDAGYINSGAVIVAGQELSPEGAVVKVQIVEGGVEEIKITGTRRLNPNYVRSRIKLGTSKPLNRDRLLKTLQLLQLNPLIERLSADVSAGSRPEQSVVEIKVVEADSFRTELFVDNGRAPSVGSFRRGIRISEGNVFGIGDGFSATYTNTDGSNALDLSYSVPVNSRNGSINIAGGFTETTVIEPPFDRIDITGDSFYIEAGFRQPIIQTPSQEFALGLSFSRQQSQTEIDGEGFPISAGANNNGQTRISALRFVQEYTQRNRRQVFALRSQFSVGIGLFDATINNDPPDSRFFSWRGQGQYIRLLAPDTILLFRSDLQFASKTLVPLEQIGLGGFQSIRGYRQDELLVDNGFFASAEVRFPILRIQEVNGVLQIVPFVDFGIGWNSSDTPNPDRNTLMSVGLGLQWQMNDTLTARIDYGIPLINSDLRDSDRTLQEKGFYFSVNYSPF